jgi:hypothetical protein
MIRGNSTAKGADKRGTISGVRFNPIRMNDIPIRIITSGAERALTPNEDLSGHNLASLLGRDANPSIPNGHQTIAGPGIGNR